MSTSQLCVGTMKLYEKERDSRSWGIKLNERRDHILKHQPVSFEVHKAFKYMIIMILVFSFPTNCNRRLLVDRSKIVILLLFGEDFFKILLFPWLKKMNPIKFRNQLQCKISKFKSDKSCLTNYEFIVDKNIRGISIKVYVQ